MSGPLFNLTSSLCLALAFGSGCISHPSPAARTSEARLTRVMVLPGVRQTRPEAGVPGRIDHMGYDSATRRLFVAALENGSVEVIDTAAGARTESISGLAQPQGIAILPRVAEIVVACGGDGRLHIFDSSTLREKAQVVVGPDADNVRYDPRTRTLLVSYGTTNRGAIAEFNIRNWNRLREIGFTSKPESFQLDPHSARMFVNLPQGTRALTDGNVAVVDRETGKLERVICLHGRARNFPMTFDSIHERLFVATRRPARLVGIDTRTYTIVSEVPCADDSDDLFCDTEKAKVYVVAGGFRPDLQEPGNASPCSPSDGSGSLEIFSVGPDGTLDRIGQTTTARHARTGLFIPKLRTIFVAAPMNGRKDPEIREYQIQ